MAKTKNIFTLGADSDPDAPVATTPSATTAQGGSFSTGSFIAGFLTGLAFGAGLTHLVIGKGKRSNASRSACPMPHDEPTLVPPPSPVVDGHDNDGCTDEVPENLHAPAGQRKLTDEDVETIRAMKDGGKPVKEIATLYGVSPKTIYARLKKNNNPENHQKTQDD